jgi:hypothetical protein
LKTTLIKINPRTCHKVAAENGIDAYVFAKRLYALNHHPILKDYYANIKGYTALLGLTDKKYIKLFNRALQLNYIAFEGPNLRIMGIQQEKTRYKARHKHYEYIKLSDLKQFILISTIKKNQALQISAVRYKEKHQPGIRSSVNSDANQNEFNLIAKQKINQNVTLSFRSAAKLFNVSLSNAHSQVNALSNFGLIINKERKEISKQFYEYLQESGNPSRRYDKATGKFYFVKPTKVSFEPFYKTGRVLNTNPVKDLNNAYYNSINW